ncbi:gliding motility-associated C-terminal domain-containing protein [bacterium]|nr:gliding motility-associated C-terminal domain-containing protein [bacterium]
MIVTILSTFNFNLFSQVIFQETFDEPNTSTTGSASGVDWSSTCPNCITGDYWEVNSGAFEGKDTNGEAEWITDNSIDVSNCSSIDISFDIESLGTMEGCGTGCTSVDWVAFQYNIDGAGWVDPPSSYFCAGPCADMNVVASDNVGAFTYSTGCLPINGNNLKLRIVVQCWASSEFWRIDNVTVTCNAVDPGTDGNHDICSSANPVNLFDILGGTPNAGGAWAGPSTLTGGDLGTFNPATMSPGTYVYTVGTLPCQASSTVTVSGSNNLTLSIQNETICLGETATLTAVPSQTGGTFSWSPSGNNSSSNSYSPLTTTSYSVSYTLGNCSVTESADIIVNPLPIVNAGIDQTICHENQVTLNGTGAQSYSWDNAVINGSPFTPAVGNQSYTVTGTDASGCSSTDVVVVTVLQNPTANGYVSTLSGSSPLTVSVDNLSSDAISYQWNFGNGNTFNTDSTETVSIDYTAPGNYTIELSAVNGQCQDNWNQSITVYQANPLVVTVPNVFSPNNDGINDMYQLSFENALSIDASIFNRWGNIIASYNDLNFSWDGSTQGSEAAEGTYFIKFQVTGIDGTTKSGQSFFQLIR